jgi:hypothetical protein
LLLARLQSSFGINVGDFAVSAAHLQRQLRRNAKIMSDLSFSFFLKKKEHISL